MKKKTTFGFTRPFQNKVLALLLTDRVVLGSHIDYIEPIHFDGMERVQLAEWLFVYFKQYRECPSESVVYEIADDSGIREETKEAVLRFYKDKVLSVVKSASREAEYIRSRLSEFIRYQSYVAGLIRSKEAIEKGDLDAVAGIMNEAFTIAASVETGTFYFDELKDRIYERQQLLIRKAEMVVPTLIPKLDNALDGGMRAGEMGVVVMGPGVGKSMFLIHMAKAAVLGGMAALYYSLELYPLRLEARFDATFSGIKTRELSTYPEEVRSKIRSIYLQAQGDLLLRYAPPNSISISALDSHIARLANESSFYPQVICIDYADLLVPRDERIPRHLQLTRIYEDLRSLGRKYSCSIWTASQPKAEGWDEDLIEINQAAGAWGKSHFVDVMLTAQRDREVPNSPIIRMFTGKIREGEAGEVFEIETDYSRARFLRV